MKPIELVKPSKEEERVLKDSIDGFLKRLNNKLKGAKAIVGGSAAKGTWMKGDYDVDIFVKFNQGYRGKDISKLLENKLKKNYKIKKVHGSRDYFQIKEGLFTHELVPILDIRKASSAENITDISPLHTKWINSKLNKRLKDEVRLIKGFCKANRLYGAESYIRGFSGYVLEILVFKYKSFSKLLKESGKWKYGEVIDVARHKGVINKAKLGPLIIVDPVDNSRNTAAALSKEKFLEFKEVAKKFLRNPNVSFFIKRIKAPEELRGALVLKVDMMRGKRDVVGAKLVKVYEYIERRLKKEGFGVRDSGWEWDKEAVIWFFTKKDRLEKRYEHYGPPIKEERHVEVFKEKYGRRRVREKKGKLYVILTRKFTDVEGYIKNLIRDDYINKRVRGINLVKKL